MSRDVEENDERRRQRKLEEALEVKSLRRIISAYLNYPESSQEDVKRNERSFKKLPPSHKALVSHYPMKFQRLRRCIAANSYFIFAMLQAFEPPLDMSQDLDTCEDSNLENAPNGDLLYEERITTPSQSESTSTCSNHDQASSREGSGAVHNMFTEGSQGEHLNEQVSGYSRGPREEKDDHSTHDISHCNGNIQASPNDWLDPSMQLNVPLIDVDKVRCIIRNIVRDWAAEGQKERDQCYNPILQELESVFPNRSKESPPVCLVPGAGLGRLALEISRLGFISQGNEFSYYMMICSSFILNHTQTAGQWTIYPWIHSNCNSLSDDDQLRAVPIPDILPATAGITEGFSMCGGDFVEVYNESCQIGVWDVVVTCFFIDTAHNIVEYIEIISRILKEGGVWINLGPLLYHFADMYGQEDEMSIELSLEDVKKVAFHYGFELEKEQTIETTYTTNPRSMMQNRYFTAFWTMRKKTAATQQQMHLSP